MRVLFDKNVPYGARNFLNTHQVETVDDHDWATISNGELLQSAEAAGFDVVVTADQNIVYQQALSWSEDFPSSCWPRTSGPSCAATQRRSRNR